MEYFAKESSFSPEKWEIIVSVFTMLRKEGRDTNTILPDEVYNGILIGRMLEEIRLLRGAGKLTESEVRTLQDLNVRVQYRKYRWMYMYNRAKDYFILHGHLQVKVSEDYDLCQWVGDQRKKFREAPRIREDGTMDTYSRHTEEQKRMLEEIDIDWDVSAFNKYYPLLVKFHSKWPDEDVPNHYWDNGLELSHWVYFIRSGRGKITEEQKEMLLKIGFDFKKTERTRYVSGTSLPEQVVYFYFKKAFKDANNRIKVEGFELDIYSKKAGIAIEYDGFIAHKSKAQMRIDNEKDDMCERKHIKLIRIREEGLAKTKSAINYFVPATVELLDEPLRVIFKNELGSPDLSIDFKRDCMEIQDYYLNLDNIAINRHIKELIEYKRDNNCFPPPSTPKNSGLYGVVNNLRQLKKGKGGRLTEKQIKELDSIGMIWDKFEYLWEIGYNHAQKYFDKYKNLNVSSDYKSPNDNYNLGRWIYQQRRKRNPLKPYHGKKLTDDQIKKLDDIGMIW